MSKKAYLVKQERKFNGDVTVATLNYTCDESEIQAILDKLEGKLTVYTEDLTLSSPEEASNVVTGGLPIDSIAMVHSEAKTQYFGAFGKPVLFKATVSAVELQNLFKTHKPFVGNYAAETPDEVYPKIGSIGNL